MSDMLPRPEPRDAFKRALRSQLMAQAPGVLARRETTWSRLQGVLLRPALAAAVVLLVLAAGAGKAAADSLAGDAVFAVKRAAEDLQLALALDDPTRLRVLAEQADHRLAELAESVTAHPEKAKLAQTEYASAVKKLTTAVDAVRSQPNVSEDKKTAAEDVVDAAHRKHVEVLAELKKKVGSSTENADVENEIDNATDESEKLHASDRPARSPQPSSRPDRSRSPQPTRTAPPSRTPSKEGERSIVPTVAPSVRR